MPRPFDSSQVRRTFIDFFAARGHEEVASSALVPANDPTLMFTNAGMVQFKDVFTGQAKRAKSRATSAQKCVRAGGKHNDLENVGRTARHHTFFEMLGNFSFGDYFKEDAILFAHELLTKDYALDANRLIYTVHHSDDEARGLWKRIAGVGDDRVVGLGDKDNFWAMGDTGPCGPCSEIHFLQGNDIPCVEEAAGRTCEGPACDCDRWVEIWNLVFMQFEQLPGPARERRPLPKPSVDTGMGLERLCAVLQGVRSNYETDLLRPLVEHVATLAKKRFDPRDFSGASASMRAVADHARATAFLIADGVLPDKTGRDYVLRRIMRRGIYHGWLLGIRQPFLGVLVGDVIAQMAGVYSELAERRSLILEVAEQEEKRFRDTLERGMSILDEEVPPGHYQPGRTIPGELAFKLYDTFGFPLDLTRVIAAQRQVELDEKGFEEAMETQRKRSEFASSGEVAIESVYKELANKTGETTFLGYGSTEAKSRITALVADGVVVDRLDATAKAVGVVVESTPFYGESGGQVGDKGVLVGPSGKLVVTDTKKPVGSMFVHVGASPEGKLAVGDEVTLVVDTQLRDATRRNHSATHLLHWALRKVLGEHVAQKGSLVAPDRLRFDFSHFAPLTRDEKLRVEDLVNERIRKNTAADTAVLAIAEAKKAGAVAFFGEKYGETVRVVSMEESKEFCGGTHVARTGDIAFFKIVEETGVAQGVRRIEAATGANALAYVRTLEQELGIAAESLKTNPLDVAARVQRLQEGLKERDREIEKLKKKLASGGGRDLLAEARDIAGVRVLATRADVADPKALREVADQLRDKLKSGVLVLAGVEGEKIALVSMVTADLAGKFHAGKIIGEIAKDLGGKGGGRPDMAQGGGTQPEKLDAALARVFELCRA